MNGNSKENEQKIKGKCTDNQRQTNRKGKTVFVTVAGLSNALGGVVAANSKKPVVNCPFYKDKVDMNTNLNSSIMMPSGVPSSYINRPDNLALFIKKLFQFSALFI